MNDVDVAIGAGREALIVILKLSLPLLLVGLVVGVIISIFQAATQIQEQTLTFIPKIIAVVGTLYLILPWLMAVLIEYTENVIRDMTHMFG